MKPIQKLILILGLIWIGVKLFLHQQGLGLEYFQLSLTLNFAFIVFIAYSALKSFYQTEEGTKSDFIGDLKVALGSTLKYTILIFGFLVFYYLVVNKNFAQELAHANVENNIRPQVEAAGGYEAFLEQYKDELSKVEDLPDTAEGYYQAIETDLVSSLPMSVVLPSMLLGLFILTIGISAFGAGVFKRFMPKHN